MGDNASLPTNIFPTMSTIFLWEIYLDTFYYVRQCIHQCKYPSLLKVQNHQCPLIDKLYKCLVTTPLIKLAIMY